MENLQIHTLPGASAADSQRLLAGDRWDGSAQLAFIVNTSTPIKSMIVDFFFLAVWLFSSIFILETAECNFENWPVFPF